MSELKQLAPVDEIKLTLSKMANQFKAALPPQVSVERFTRVAMTAISQTPSLVKCERNSLYSAFMRCAQSGLLPDGKEAAIVPFGDKATFMPMVAGILKQVRNSGELASITPGIIKEKDQFRYWVDSDGAHLNHEPELFKERGAVIGAYALAKTKDGATYIDVMPMDEIEKIRNVSRSKDSGPWKQWWDEMAKKSVIRRLAKLLPSSTDLESLLREDDDLFMPGPSEEDLPREAREPAKKSSTLGKIIEEHETVDIKPEPATNSDIPI